MSYQLLINGPVPTWDEFGGYSHLRIADLKDRLRLTDAWIDPLTGFLSARPVYSPVNENSANWPGISDATNWHLRKVESEERTQAMYYAATSAWTAPHLPTGQGVGFSLFFCLAPLAGGTNDTLTVDFGGIWRLLLTENQEAELLKWNATLETPAYETQVFFENPLGSLYEPQRLLLYEAGDRLVIKDWKLLESGFCWIDPEPELGPGNLPHALRAGTPQIAGTGRVHLALRTQEWATPWSAQLDPPQSLMTPSTQGQTHLFYAWQPTDTSLTLTVYDQDGTEWPATPDEDDPERTAFYWILSGSSTDSQKTAIVGRVEVNIARSLTSSGTEAVDLASVAKVISVELTKSLDPGGCQLTALVKDRANLSAYIQPGMRLDFVLDSVTLHTGLLLDPQRVVLGPPGTSGASLEALQLTSKEDRRLDIGSLFNLDAQDGEDIADALQATLEAAAIPAGNITVPAMGFPIPSADPEEEPNALPSPGDSPKKFLEYLLETYAADYTWRPLANFYYEILPRNAGGASVATFYRTHAAAITAGYPNQYLLRGLQEVYTDSGYANMVIVVGQAKNGDILVAVEVQWEHIHGEEPYLPVILAIVDENLKDLETCNAVARAAADRVFTKPIRFSIKIPFYNLTPGATITLDGDGDFRVLNWSLRLPSRVREQTVELEVVV